jgi:hypothetical protein
VGATLVTSSTVNFSAVSCSGNLVSKVFSNDPNSPFSGGLTFTYELNTDPVPGGQSMSLLTISSFTFSRRM